MGAALPADRAHSRTCRSNISLDGRETHSRRSVSAARIRWLQENRGGLPQLDWSSQQAGKVADRVQLLEAIHALDDGVGSAKADHGRHELARFCSHACGIQRIFLGPWSVPREVANHTSVTEHHVDPAAARSGRIHERAISHQLNALLDGLRTRACRRSARQPSRTECSHPASLGRRQYGRHPQAAGRRSARRWPL